MEFNQDKFTLLIPKDGTLTLYRNGIEQQCPLRPPLRVPMQAKMVGSAPEIMEVHSYCDSNCAQFRTVEHAGGIGVKQLCLTHNEVTPVTLED